jgi:hypothetical protein
VIREEPNSAMHPGTLLRRDGVRRDLFAKREVAAIDPANEKHLRASSFLVAALTPARHWRHFRRQCHTTLLYISVSFRHLVEWLETRILIATCAPVLLRHSGTGG